MSINIGMIEDDEDIRKLLGFIIDQSPGYACTQRFASCEDGIKEILTHPPDILLMDIDLPGINGVEGVRTIRKHNTRMVILMLTIHEDDDSVFASLCAGANGYLLKGTPPVRLLAALEDAHQGGAPMSAQIANKVVRYFHQSKGNDLSDREIEILSGLCRGENYSSLADILFISKNTVKSHIKNIYKKLHVHTRAEAVLKARELGIK